MLFNPTYKFGCLLIVLMLQISISFSQSFAPEKTMRMTGDTPSSPLSSRGPDLDLRPKNNVFINFFGDGSVASLNYERLFFTDPEHFFIATGAGIGANLFVLIHNTNGGTSYDYETYFLVPHHVTFNVGKGRHFFEFGAGGAIFAGPRVQPYLPYLTAGYRLQPWNNQRVHFRLYGSYPLESLEKFEILYVPVGLSVGWSF